MGYKWRNRNDNNLMFAHPDRGCVYASLCVNCPFKVCYDDLTETVKRRIGKWSTEEIKEFLLNGR